MDRAERSGRRAPLRGLRVLVTRPARQAPELSERLRLAGAEPVELPTIRIDDPPDPLPLRRAAASLASYDWLVFTSVNGVERLREAADATGSRASDASACRTAAIGPATAAEVRSAGLPDPLVPDRYRAEVLLEAILEAARGEVGEARFLLPRAAEARDLLPEGLRSAGAEVDVVPAYVTVPARASAGPLRELLAARAVDWITFTASSTVRAFHELAGTETGGARVAAIGPITAATACELGVGVDLVAREHTMAGLVDALARAERGEGPAGGGTPAGRGAARPEAGDA